MSGRELKVSELEPGTEVRVWKQGRPTLTMRVIEVADAAVCLQVLRGAVVFNFLARRCGPDQEQITDDDQLRMRLFEP
jgi:hypothetical protein